MRSPTIDRSAHVVLLAALVLGCAAPCRADERFDKQVRDAREKFTKSVETAKKNVLNEYGRTIASLRASSALTESARKDKVEQWTNARKLFETKTLFPLEDEFAATELNYFLAVSNAFAPVAKLYNDKIKSANKAGNGQLADETLQAKSELAEKLLGVTRFSAYSRWHGTFERGGATIPYHLNVGKKAEGGTFTGHVEDNPGVAGNWAYDVEGQTEGLGVEFVMTKSLRGNFKEVRVTGIVSGDRLIANVTQSTGGKPGTGLLILRLVK